MAMRNLLLTGVVIGGGIAIGIAGMNAIGGVAYKAAATYVEIQQAKDPIYIDAQNEQRFTELLNRITASRHDDMQRCMDMFASEAGANPNYGKDVGNCSAQYGWDNTSLPDLTKEYIRVMRPKLEAGWIGDHAWLEQKLNKYYK
jgi:hypothetical protein